MIRNTLNIGSWLVEFYFAPDGYNSEVLIDRLYDFGAGSKALHEALALMESGELNTGFTFPNPFEHIAIVAIGPTSSSAEFVNTLVHEVHHLAVAIASELGVDLESESPAYVAGDTARELAEVICELGCPHCH